jgi:hypothetical protein
LCYTEKEVWDLTPRQLKAQLDVHFEVISKRGSQGTNNPRDAFGYIDQIPDW